MPDPVPYEITTQGAGDVTLVLSGRLDIARFGILSPLIRDLFASYNPLKLDVDMTGIDYIDSTGALFIIKLEDEARARNVPFSTRGLSKEKMGILGLIDRQAIAAVSLAPAERTLSIIEQLGNASIRAVEDVYDIISFSGELVYELLHSTRHFRKVRWGDVVSYMKKVGVDGLPIVGLISFLLGLIMAFMSSLQLKQFGANIICRVAGRRGYDTGTRAHHDGHYRCRAVGFRICCRDRDDEGERRGRCPCNNGVQPHALPDHTEGDRLVAHSPGADYICKRICDHGGTGCRGGGAQSYHLHLCSADDEGYFYLRRRIGTFQIHRFCPCDISHRVPEGLQGTRRRGSGRQCNDIGGCYVDISHYCY
jgi:anti-anti-sigma regulatory factor